jgi:hypothetical protein
MEDGAALKTGVTGSTITRIRMQRGVETQLDGTIDNTVVAHEWGHYLHMRLATGGSQSFGGMSEGWADFNAIMMVVKSGDTFGDNCLPDGAIRFRGPQPERGYFGIRARPYAESHTKNPFTFKHIRQAEPLPTTALLAPTAADNSEVHNVGEIWAQTLFQGYIKLLALGPTSMPARTFDESKRRMADYVVQGLKAAPPDPTFVEHATPSSGRSTRPARWTLGAWPTFWPSPRDSPTAGSDPAPSRRRSTRSTSMKPSRTSAPKGARLQQLHDR